MFQENVKKNKLINFNKKCQETRVMLILKFKCLSVANTKKSLIQLRTIKNRTLFFTSYNLGFFDIIIYVKRL
jgi:hypothetical protein